MPTEIMGDDLVGDDLLGDDVGDDALGDLLVGEDVGDDVMGETEIMGDDLVGDYLVGAAVKKKLQQNAKARAAKATAMRNAMLAKRLKLAKVVHSRGPTKSRIQSIGFTRAAVPANATVEITARPQVLFRGTRLMVGSSIAQNFVIEDIKVGRASQFVATGGQPAEAFKDTATGENVALDTCSPGVDLTLIITNISGTSSDFRASLFGDVVE